MFGRQNFAYKLAESVQFLESARTLEINVHVNSRRSMVRECSAEGFNDILASFTAVDYDVDTPLPCVPAV